MTGRKKKEDSSLRKRMSAEYIKIWLRQFGVTEDYVRREFGDEFYKNLYIVVYMSIKYSKLGVDLDDLITVATEGLRRACVRFEEVKDKEPKMKVQLLDDFRDIFSQSVTGEIGADEFKAVMLGRIKYGKTLLKAIDTFAAGTKPITEDRVRRFIESHITKYSLSSIAFNWIRAYILNEIDAYSRVVKKTKHDIYEDAKKDQHFSIEQCQFFSGIDTANYQYATDALDMYVTRNTSDAVDDPFGDENKIKLDKVLSTLPGRDSALLRAYANIDGLSLTQQEIADKYGFSTKKDMKEYAEQLIAGLAAKYRNKIDLFK